MVLAHSDGRRCHFPVKSRQVCDVTGAGDMVLSVLGICLGAGLDFEEGIRLANVAAGLEVERLGSEILTRADLITEARHSRCSGRRTASVGEKILPLPA